MDENLEQINDETITQNASAIKLNINKNKMMLFQKLEKLNDKFQKMANQDHSNQLNKQTIIDSNIVTKIEQVKPNGIINKLKSEQSVNKQSFVMKEYRSSIPNKHQFINDTLNQISEVLYKHRYANQDNIKSIKKIDEIQKKVKLLNRRIESYKMQQPIQKQQENNSLEYIVKKLHISMKNERKNAQETFKKFTEEFYKIQGKLE